MTWIYGEIAVWAHIPEAERLQCSHVGEYGFCGVPATHHVIWDFQRASPVCTEHKAVAEDGGDFLDIHGFDPAVCPVDGTEFDGDRNRCVLKRLS